MKEETSLYTVMESLPSFNDDCLAFIVSAIEAISTLREYYTIDGLQLSMKD